MVEGPVMLSPLAHQKLPRAKHMVCVDLHMTRLVLLPKATIVLICRRGCSTFNMYAVKKQPSQHRLAVLAEQEPSQRCWLAGLLHTGAE